jgi:NAD(P)-dependent dehydrogenase (short-subunit alcohol dehydrogenase family)
MKIAGSIALVTGANRGLGLAFAKALVEMGAAKVYAAARNPEAVTLKGVVPLKLDVTSDEDVIAAARAAGNVNLLVNNAGIARPGGFLAGGAVEAAREQFEVNFFGPLRIARAFAPVLAKNGGGAIINVLSVASWMNGPGLATYGASKSAAWALTNGLRLELAQQGTQVVGLHAGFIDTDLARDIDAPKSSPKEIVRTTLEAIERGDRQVLADEISRRVHRGLSARRDFPAGASRPVRGPPGLFPDHSGASLERWPADRMNGDACFFWTSCPSAAGRDFNAARCVSNDWPFVDTRAYPIMVISVMASSQTFLASASVMSPDDTMTAYVSDPVSTAVSCRHCRPSNTAAMHRSVHRRGR